MLTINNTVEGYLKDVEIKGNTWQDSENLADIRSVGTKVEGQELYEIPVLSCGKNLFNATDVFNTQEEKDNYKWYVFKLKPSTEYIMSSTLPQNNRANMFLKVTDSDYTRTFGWLCHTNNTNIVNSVKFTTDYQGRIGIAFRNVSNNDILNTLNSFFIYEGTQVIPYEPYQEHKLTILSPTPLERVGDVADRIVCKDGVWGVEKNVNIFDIKNSTNALKLHMKKDNTCRFSIPNAINTIYENLITTFGEPSIYYLDKEGVAIDKGTGNVFIQISYSKLGLNIDAYSPELINKATEFITKQNMQILYIHSQPQFIPLPSSQQIKLRTFADRTNISFETEIQPTIKAQVPKSLGATVNTHTTQIDNLNKELDRVKKLEESTVSTVTSDKSFTTVAETTQGYFEDVKIEGKTLVNLADIQNKFVEQTDIYYKDHTLCSTSRLKLNNPYTFIIDCKYLEGHNSNYNYFEFGVGKIVNGYNSSVVTNLNMNRVTMPNSGVYVLCVEFKDFRGYEYLACRPCRRSTAPVEGEIANYDISVLLLEGDHTDKDLNFFEGLKSVGQDTDEISVSSVDNGNLFDGELELGAYTENSGVKTTSTTVIRSVNYIRTYGIKYLNIIGNETTQGQYRIFKYDKDKKYLGTFLASKTEGFALDNNVEYITFHNNTAGNLNINIIISPTRNVSNDNIKQDKKQILYYNPTTQTWEKPVLREWDSIEKRGDKYYYIKRSSEIKLDGSESGWLLNNKLTPSFVTFYINLSKLKGNNSKLICDRFKHLDAVPGKDIEFIKVGNTTTYIYININPTNLSTQDVAGFKKWLQANPVTVVYELKQEEVYECTNLDLITYNGETNLIVNSGAIQPKLELKVLSNVSNVVKLLQEKVSILENNTSSYIVTQNRLQLASTYAADSVTFKVDYASAFDNRSVDGYNPDLYNLILSNILVGKDNYGYDKMFSIILDYASWDQISWEQFDELVLLMDIQHNPPIEIPEEDYTEEEIPEI